MLAFSTGLPAVTVDIAILAGGFDQGALRRFNRAYSTERGTPTGGTLSERLRGIPKVERPLLPPVSGSAVDADKLHDDLEVFCLRGS